MTSSKTRANWRIMAFVDGGLTSQADSARDNVLPAGGTGLSAILVDGQHFSRKPGISTEHRVMKEGRMDILRAAGQLGAFAKRLVDMARQLSWLSRSRPVPQGRTSNRPPSWRDYLDQPASGSRVKDRD